LPPKTLKHYNEIYSLSTIIHTYYFCKIIITFYIIYFHKYAHAAVLLPQKLVALLSQRHAILSACWNTDYTSI